jgi:hypothetical protein
VRELLSPSSFSIKAFAATAATGQFDASLLGTGPKLTVESMKTFAAIGQFSGGKLLVDKNDCRFSVVIGRPFRFARIPFIGVFGISTQ